MNLIFSFCVTVGVLLGATAAVSIYDRYNTRLDQFINWDEIRENYKEMEEEALSYEQAQKVREIQTDVQNTQYLYCNATESVFEWCSKGVQIIRRTRYFFDRFPDLAENQKKSIKEELEDGIGKMDASRRLLTQSLAEFKPVLNKVLAVKDGISDDGYNTIRTAVTQIANVRIDLQDERYSIGEMKVKAQQVIKLTRMITFRDALFAGIDNMIDQCNDFRQKHA